MRRTHVAGYTVHEMAKLLAEQRHKVIDRKLAALIEELGGLLDLLPSEVTHVIRGIVALPPPDYDGIEHVQDMPRCHDCGAPPGYTHRDGCDTERCTVCGGQRLQCGCEGHDKRRAFWTGMWPGAEACMELGWYSKMVAGRTGWHRCSPSDPDGTQDMNRWMEFVLKHREV